MKRAALDATDNAKLCDIRYGTVISVSPLNVKITSQFILPQSVLIIPQHLTDYSVSVMLSGGEASETPSTNDGSTTTGGEQIMTVKNALKIGDKVALLRQSGGQYYFILDRI